MEEQAVLQSKSPNALLEEQELPENPTPSEKVKLASKYKELGTRYLVEGKLQEALEELNRAFVFVFSPRDEWELLYSSEDRLVINQFKIPCHLNRGLCKWKLGNLEDALWDFDEALRLDPKNIKALYRRGTIYSQLLQRQLQKDERGEAWDPEEAEKFLSRAKRDLRKAYELKPDDSAIVTSLRNVKDQEKKLSNATLKYHQQQRKIFSHVFKKLDEENHRVEEPEEDLPKLEKISLDNY